ncbi:MAG TPA: hypothetical protein VFW94_18360, partial [Candidatus Acidoferrales bacterium]|nr:hypothetical protein [Candidatus Acidoferrales bacterium]
ALAVGQNDQVEPQTIKMSALQIRNANGVRELRGRVRIETSSFVLTADQANFDFATHDISAHGNVHVKLK